MRGHRVNEHGDDVFGFSTCGQRIPDARIYVAVLCNSDAPPTGPAYRAAPRGDRPWHAVRRTRGGHGRPSVSATHVGVYEIDAPNRRPVTFENGRALHAAHGWTAPRRTPAFGQRVRLRERLTSFTFERDASGKTVAMLMYRMAPTRPCARFTVADTVTATAVSREDAAIYGRSDGRYKLRPGFVLAITREGDQLMAQATGQGKFEIFASSETECFVKVVDARMTFVKGPTGPRGSADPAPGRLRHAREAPVGLLGARRGQA